MSFRYNPIERVAKTIYRIFFPITKSSYTKGPIADICSVELIPPGDLKLFFSKCIQRLQASKGKEIGDYLEFGVFNGSSMASMYHAAKDAGETNMRFIGFDAFQGLPPNAEHEDDGVWKQGYYACSFEKLQECLKKKKVNPKEILWVKGWYNETLNKKTIQKLNIKKIAIAFIDCDTYSSSKTVLEFLGPLLKEETILCFDDWKLNDLDIKGMGEYQSFNEFLENNPHLSATEIPSYRRKSRCFIVGPKKE